MQVGSEDSRWTVQKDQFKLWKNGKSTGTGRSNCLSWKKLLYNISKKETKGAIKGFSADLASHIFSISVLPVFFKITVMELTTGVLQSTRKD